MEGISLEGYYSKLNSLLKDPVDHLTFLEKKKELKQYKKLLNKLYYNQNACKIYPIERRSKLLLKERDELIDARNFLIPSKKSLKGSVVSLKLSIERGEVKEEDIEFVKKSINNIENDIKFIKETVVSIDNRAESVRNELKIINKEIGCLKFGYQPCEAKEIMEEYISKLPRSGKIGGLGQLSFYSTDEKLPIDINLYGIQKELLRMDHLAELVTLLKLMMNFPVICDIY